MIGMVKYELENHNGLPVLLIKMPGVKSVTSLILANTGSRFEQPEQAGIAHFFEHMVFKGTAKYATPQKIASTIDAIGAEFNAFTSKEYTGYYIKSAGNHLRKALDVLSDMILQPALRQTDIDREKGVIIEEINMYRDNPMYYVGNLFEQLVYQDFGLKHDIIGTKETVSSLTTDHFKQFLTEWYGLPNLLLILAGDDNLLSNSGTNQLIQEAFTKQTNQPRMAAKAKVDSYLSSSPFTTNQLHVEKKETEQAHLIIGWPGLPRATEFRPVLSVLGTVLGGNMSSRLFSEVREKRGLCYYIRSDVDYYHETGLVGASAGVDPKRVYEAIKVIINEFNQLATASKPATAGELKRAKEYIRGTMTLSFENSKSVAQHFGIRQLLLNQVESLEETLAKIDQVSLDDLHQLAKQLFVGQKPKLAVIGPFEDKAKFAELLK